jgi:hypothetical protein
MLYLTPERRSVGHKRLMNKLKYEISMCKLGLPFEVLLLENARRC